MMSINFGQNHQNELTFVIHYDILTHMNQKIRYSTEFTAGVYYENRLTMSRFYVTLWMCTNTDDESELNVALDRIRFFINHSLSNTIFIDEDNIKESQRLLAANLSVTTLPTIPVDQIICLVLHSKLNAICEDRLIVSDIELSSDFGEKLVYVHSVEDGNIYDECYNWWTVRDLSHSDAVNKSGRIVSLGKVRSWRDVGLSFDTDDIVFETNTNTVIFGDFGENNK